MTIAKGTPEKLARVDNRPAVGVVIVTHRQSSLIETAKTTIASTNSRNKAPRQLPKQRLTTVYADKITTQFLMRHFNLDVKEVFENSQRIPRLLPELRGSPSDGFRDELACRDQCARNSRYTGMSLSRNRVRFRT